MKRILLLTANPSDTGRLRLSEEAREIDEGLKRSSHREQFKLFSKGSVRVHDLHRAMLEVNPHIVHFSGHGSGKHGLAFEDENGKTQLLLAEQLGRILRLFVSRSLSCVVLNACYSEVQAQVLKQSVPYVICMNQAIGDRAAIAFSVAFYDALGAGESIDFSFELAKAQIINLQESQKLVLLKNTAVIVQQEQEASRTNLAPREHTLILLQSLLPSQFDNVVFKYNVPPSHLSISASQSQRSMEVIHYAEQKEGGALTQLLTVITQVAPHVEVKNG